MGEQGVQEGTKHAPLRVPVLRVNVTDVLLPSLTSWGRSVIKSSVRGGFDLSPVLTVCLFDGSQEVIVGFIISVRNSVPLLESGSSSL